jgi:outer membrane protein OmpA-like peptidoglycan-associated protein
MKKSLLLLASIIGLSTLNAQTFEQTTKFRDNWSIGINGGIVSPLTHSAFFKNARATVGVNLNKQFSPIYGLTVENMWNINAFDSQAAFDATNLSLLHRVNLNNVFCKYDGKPDLFEVEAVAGFGWLHVNDAYSHSWEGEPIPTDANWITSKAGLNFNFNLGEKKAWTVAVKPAITWCMTKLDRHNIQFDANQAAWEITAGVVYHFKNSNGTHYLVNGCSHASEIAALNATIGSMEAEAASKDRALQNAQNTINDLEKALNDCKNKKPVVQKPVEDLDIVINFRQSSYRIDALQMVNIDRLAKFMKKNKDAKVVVKGYASPEGDKTFNEKLSQKRADAIKNKLVKDYKIAEDRIIATGEGVGSVFDTPKFNRASICVAK